MKEITRTFVTTSVIASNVETIDGTLKEVALPDLVFCRSSEVSKKEIYRELHKRNPEANAIVIKETKVKEEVRAISFEDFYNHSRVIERPASQQKKA